MEIDLPFGVQEWAPIEDDPNRYKQWVSLTQPCLVSKRTMSDPHHVTSRGAGGGERDNIVPLQRVFHSELHNIGRDSFAIKYGLDLRREAIRITNEYDEGHI